EGEGQKADDRDEADDEADDGETAEENERVRGVPLDVGVVFAYEQEDQACDPAHKVGEDRVSLLVAAHAARDRLPPLGCRWPGGACPPWVRVGGGAVVESRTSIISLLVG